MTTTGLLNDMSPTLTVVSGSSLLAPELGARELGPPGGTGGPCSSHKEEEGAPPPILRAAALIRTSCMWTADVDEMEPP